MESSAFTIGQMADMVQLLLCLSTNSPFPSVTRLHEFSVDGWARNLIFSRSGLIPSWAWLGSGKSSTILIDGTRTVLQAGAQFESALQPLVQERVGAVDRLTWNSALSIFNVIDKASWSLGQSVAIGGFSYGAGIAEILGVLIHLSWPSLRIRTLAVGAPRVGDSSFCALSVSTNLTRLMSGGDPVPFFPPKLEEAPLGVVALQSQGSYNFQTRQQPSGGLVVFEDGSLVSANMPPYVLPIKDVYLLQWLTATAASQFTEHSLSHYLSLMVRCATRYEGRLEEKVSVSPFAAYPALTLGAFAAGVAAFISTTAAKAVKESNGMAYVPTQYRAMVNKVGTSYTVTWMNLLIAGPLTQSQCRTVAKYLNKWIRTMQERGPIVQAQLVAAINAFAAISQSGAAGFDPPFTWI